jgi:hypothetical protein
VREAALRHLRRALHIEHDGWPVTWSLMTCCVSMSLALQIRVD